MGNRSPQAHGHQPRDSHHLNDGESLPSRRTIIPRANQNRLTTGVVRRPQFPASPPAQRPGGGNPGPT
jgi:hypothetical protein